MELVEVSGTYVRKQSVCATSYKQRAGYWRLVIPQDVRRLPLSYVIGYLDTRGFVIWGKGINLPFYAVCCRWYRRLLSLIFITSGIVLRNVPSCFLNCLRYTCSSMLWLLIYRSFTGSRLNVRLPRWKRLFLRSLRIHGGAAFDTWKGRIWIFVLVL